MLSNNFIKIYFKNRRKHTAIFKTLRAYLVGRFLFLFFFFFLTIWKQFSKNWNWNYFSNNNFYIIRVWIPLLRTIFKILKTKKKLFARPFLFFKFFFLKILQKVTCRIFRLLFLDNDKWIELMYLFFLIFFNDI